MNEFNKWKGELRYWREKEVLLKILIVRKSVKVRYLFEYWVYWLNYIIYNFFFFKMINIWIWMIMKLLSGWIYKIRLEKNLE